MAYGGYPRTERGIFRMSSQTAALHHLLACRVTVQGSASKALIDADNLSGRYDLVTGISRTYQPVEDDGEKLPSERKDVQVRIADLLSTLDVPTAAHFDLVASIDATNATAIADIALADGTVLATAVPATTLLFCEKQLSLLLGFARKLPLVDPAERWSEVPDPAVGCRVTTPVETARSKKITRFQSVARPTDHHPEQVAQLQEDVIAGYWSTVKSTGALLPRERDDLVARLIALLEAVRIARETANTAPVVNKKIGAALTRYALSGVASSASAA